VENFLRENIFYEMRFPWELVIDQGAQFTSSLIEGIMEQPHIRHKKYTPYHPQENGLVEVMNRNLERIFTKFVSNNKRD